MTALKTKADKMSAADAIHSITFARMLSFATNLQNMKDSHS